MASALDWTVDKLLSSIAWINDKVAEAQARTRANRATYMTTLRSLPEIPNVATREDLRSRLRAWIPGQVDTENRLNAFVAQFASAKLSAKNWLQSVGVTPPSYLGAAVLVPIAIYAAIAAAIGIVTAIVIAAVNQGKTVTTLENISRLARDEHWTPEQTRAALAAAQPPAVDPLGLTGSLKAALPVIVIGGLLYFFAPQLKQMVSSRRAA